MFPIIQLSGSAAERGNCYGSTAAHLIRHSIGSYARLFAYARGLDWSQMCSLAGAYLPILSAHAPTIVEEMRGIAQGSARQFDEILALNVRTELLAGALADGQHPQFAAASARNQKLGVGVEALHLPTGAARTLLNPAHAVPTSSPDHGECTTLVALPETTIDGRAWLAQNWDWTGDQRAACVLLRIQGSSLGPQTPDILTLTEAGIVAKIGLNSAGLGVTLNILGSQLDGQSPGMPIHVLLRLALETSSVAAAAECVRAVSASASSCITVADASGQAMALEITPAGVQALYPQRGLLTHTNHCVDQTAAQFQSTPSPSSVPRYTRAGELLQSHYGRIDCATLAGILRDRQNAPLCICRYPDAALHPCDRTEAVAAVIMDLGARIIHIAPDIPDQVPFEPVAVAHA